MKQYLSIIDNLDSMAMLKPPRVCRTYKYKILSIPCQHNLTVPQSEKP